MPKKILTKKRQAWSESHPDVALQGERLNYNASIQAKYIADLNRLIDEMVEQTKKQIVKLFKSESAQEFYAMDENIASQARILANALREKFEMLFNKRAKPIAERMIGATDRVSKSNLHSSLKKLSGGLTIKTNLIPPDLKTIVRASVTENVALIKSIGSDYLSRVEKTVMRSIVNGDGLKTLVPALEKYKGITKRHAKNMALDQTRKVYNSMNKSRMQKIGITKFKWIHSGGGQKPRQDHIAMNGKIYSFDNLPVIDKNTGERGIPGQAINCGCTMVPVFEFNRGE